MCRRVRWTQVDTFVYYDGGGTNVPSARLTVLRRMPGSNVTGTHVIDFGTGTPAEVLWSIDQSDANVDTGGTNGSAAIVQTAQGTGATAALLATLAAFGSADNGTFGAGVIYASGMSAWTVGTGFTALDNYAGNFATDTSLLTEYRVDNDTTVDATASTTGNWGMLGIEIKAAAGGGGGTALDDTGWHPAVEPQTNPLTVSVW